MKTVAIFALIFATLASSELCGLQEYDPETYICIYGYYLCPIINGAPYGWCGGARGQCYSTLTHICGKSDNKLYGLEQITSSFELVTSNPKHPEVDGFTVHASGQKLTAGPNAKTSTYCPDDVPQLEGLCDQVIKNRTILGLYNGTWYPKTQVPGGQVGYMNPDLSNGALGYTQAHSSSIPANASTTGFVAFANGGFFHQDYPFGWEVCGPKPHSDDPQGVWWLRLRPSDKPVDGRCQGVNLLVKDSGLVDSDHKWAWQYT